VGSSCEVRGRDGWRVILAFGPEACGGCCKPLTERWRLWGGLTCWLQHTRSDGSMGLTPPGTLEESSYRA
jgi:hypothetical protein